MQVFYRYILILIFLINFSNRLFGQDTIIYRGFVRGILLHESIELYPDKTFKWTSEYDLNWSEYGIFEIDNNNLQLKYYLSYNHLKTTSINDSIMQNEKPVKIENFKIKKEKLYRLNKLGLKIRRIRDKSIR